MKPTRSTTASELADPKGFAREPGERFVGDVVPRQRRQHVPRLRTGKGEALMRGGEVHDLDPILWGVLMQPVPVMPLGRRCRQQPEAILGKP